MPRMVALGRDGRFGSALPPFPLSGTIRDAERLTSRPRASWVHPVGYDSESAPAIPVTFPTEPTKHALLCGVPLTFWPGFEKEPSAFIYLPRRSPRVRGALLGQGGGAALDTMACGWLALSRAPPITRGARGAGSHPVSFLDTVSKNVFMAAGGYSSMTPQSGQSKITVPVLSSLRAYISMPHCGHLVLKVSALASRVDASAPLVPPWVPPGGSPAPLPVTFFVTLSVKIRV